MTLAKLAIQTDRAAFAAMYYDRRVHTATIAARFDVAQSRLSEFAKLMGLKTRRDKGIQYTPTLNKTRIKYGPCDRRCPGWEGCTSGRLWLGQLPCETMLPDEAGEYDPDSSPTLWVIPLEVKYNRISQP